MLRLVLGSEPDEKLNIYSKEIRGLIGKGREVVCIVPDQFSFEFDKILYNELGARDFNRVQVLSFKKLSEDLIARIGTDKGTLIRQSERTALIYLALKSVKESKKLKILTRSLDKPAFIGEVSALTDSLIRAGISPKELRDSVSRLEGSVSQKLSDIADIFEAYLTILSEKSFRDESSIISIGTALAAGTMYFKDKYVYIDRFDSYSFDELGLIKEAVRTAKSVTVSLTLPEKYSYSPVSPYAMTYDTQSKLVGLAKDTNSGLKYFACRSAAKKPAGLETLAAVVSGKKSGTPTEDGSVVILSAAAVYEETDFVAAKIRELVSCGICDYNDIAVITRDISSYRSPLESSFERYDVPCFLDGKSKASEMSVILFAFAAIDAAAAQRPNTERLLKLCRSPFSDFSEEEISLIEDYTVRWCVEGKMWLEDFTVSEGDAFDGINELRRRIIEPIWGLHESCKNADAAKIAVCFNKYIENCGLAERAAGIIKDFADEGERLEAARLFKQLWNALMSCVASIYSTIGSEKLTLKEFGELLKLMLSETGISNPPQKLSSVKVYDAARSVILSPKIAFVLGVNEGRFPLDSKKTGIFSGKDSAALEKAGVKFEMGLMEKLDAERFDCFRALTCAQNQVYISYSEADISGKAARPSFYVTRLLSAMNKKPIKAEKLPAEFYSSTPGAAYYRLSVERNGSRQELSEIRNALLTIPEFREKLEAYEAYSQNRTPNLSPDIAKKLFAPKDINLTASRIDVYNKCNFRYFLNYGLNLEAVRPIEVDPANRGSIMHFIFQKVLEFYGDGFDIADDLEIEELVIRLLEEYKSEILGGDFGKTAKFLADYRRLKDACMEILFNIREEYRVSKFRPVKFEYNLTDERGVGILSIPINRSLKINIRGVVDRVDQYTAEDGQKYIRIIDYKTGAKEFKYEDLYNGLNLQLLIYMIALTEGRDSDFKDCIPAGILYMKAGFLSCTEEAEDGYSPVSDSAAERFKRSAKQLKRSGLLIEDDSAISAMDSGFSGLFVPAKKKKDGGYSQRDSSVISRESFKLLEKFVKEKIREFGAGLTIGKIAPVPAGRDEKQLPCTYCDYRSVCDRKKYIYKKISREDGERLEREITPIKEGEADAQVD